MKGEIIEYCFYQTLYIYKCNHWNNIRINNVGLYEKIISLLVNLSPCSLKNGI